MVGEESARVRQGTVSYVGHVALSGEATADQDCFINW